jgi:vacuolar-type H+-ATPase subunit I/STV1
MRFEKIFTELGQKLDEVIEKAPDIYKEKIEDPAKELLNEAKESVSELKKDFEKAVEEIKEEITLPDAIVNLKLDNFDFSEIDFEIDKKNKVVNIFFKQEDKLNCSLIRQVFLPNSADLNRVKVILSEEDKVATVIIPYKPGTEETEIIKVIYN